MSAPKIPAVSHELEFVATHTDEIDDIWFGRVTGIDPILKQLSDAVYRRADSDARELLVYLRDAISEGSAGIIRANNWHPIRDGKWSTWSEIYRGTRGRKRTLGWIALDIGYGRVGFRLIGSMSLRRGGFDGRRKFVLGCKRRMEEVHLVRDNKERYPYWSDCVIWFERKLTLQASRDELRAELTTQATKFAAASEPLLAQA